MQLRKTTITVVACLLAFIQGCTLHTVDESPEPPITIPNAFSNSGSVDAPERWWEAFNDADLNQTVERAIEGNLDMLAAWARLEQAAAVARQAGAQGRLQLNYSAGAQKSRTYASYGGGSTSESDSISHSLAASYEVDVWNRISSQERAAELDWQAARDDVETMAISLTASLADAWFAAVERRALLDLLNQQIEVSQTYLDLTEARFGQGMNSAVDVYQQRSQLASIRSQLPTVESQLAVYLQQIAVLQGQPPMTPIPGERAVQSELPPLPETGVPTDLLANRPDVRAARIRVVAADHRIGAAIADKYPIISLTGRTGFGGEDISELFSNWIWTLAANVAAPILDGNRRSAEVDRTRAVVKERLFSYGNTLLGAIQEVENALVREKKQREYIERLSDQLELAQKTLEESRSRYTAGLSDYLPVLNALQSLQSIERSELLAQRDLLSYRVQLHRALGGQWPSSLENTLNTETSDSQGERS